MGTRVAAQRVVPQPLWLVTPPNPGKTQPDSQSTHDAFLLVSQTPRTADTQSWAQLNPRGCLRWLPAAACFQETPGHGQLPGTRLLEPRVASAPHPMGPDALLSHPPPGAAPADCSPRPVPEPSAAATFPAGSASCRDQPRSGLSSAFCGPPTPHSKPNVPHRTPSQAGSILSPRLPALTPPLSNRPPP